MSSHLDKVELEKKLGILTELEGLVIAETIQGKHVLYTSLSDSLTFQNEGSKNVIAEIRSEQFEINKALDLINNKEKYNGRIREERKKINSALSKDEENYRVKEKSHYSFSALYPNNLPLNENNKVDECLKLLNKYTHLEEVLFGFAECPPHIKVNALIIFIRDNKDTHKEAIIAIIEEHITFNDNESLRQCLCSKGLIDKLKKIGFVTEI